MQKLVTRDSLTKLVTRGDDVAMHAIGRALVHLLNRQTSVEARENVTRNHNAVGFQPQDARSGCIGAKYYLKHGKLEEWQVKKWTKLGSKGYPRIAKYWAQLNEVANTMKQHEETSARQPKTKPVSTQEEMDFAKPVTHTFTDGVTWTQPNGDENEIWAWWKKVYARQEMLQENMAAKPISGRL